MSQGTLDTDRVVRLLMADAIATLGERARAEVLAAAASTEENALAQMEPVEADDSGDAAEGASLAEAQRFFDREVVDRFQQYIHDTFVDTTWPACPRHPKHPLWYSEDFQAWCCPRDGSALAPLGGLAGLHPPTI